MFQPQKNDKGGSLSENIPPLPDLNRMRQEVTSEVGQAETSSMTFEEAVRMFPDLKQMLEDGNALFQAMLAENEVLSRATKKELLVPGSQQRLFNLQMGFSRKIDEIFNMLQKEGDQIRVEVLRTIYSDMVPHWQSMVLQLHMSRMMMKRPGQIHETLLGEATALLQRATG